MTYAGTAWEFAAFAYLSKLQRLQNRVLRTTGRIPNCAPIRDLHVASKIPYGHVYYFVAKLCRDEAEVIQSNKDRNVGSTERGDAQHREYNKSKGTAVPLQAWSGPEGSRKLRFPDYMTTVQDGVSRAHRPPLPPRKCSWYSFL